MTLSCKRDNELRPISRSIGRKLTTCQMRQHARLRDYRWSNRPKKAHSEEQRPESVGPETQRTECSDLQAKVPVMTDGWWELKLNIGVFHD